MRTVGAVPLGALVLAWEQAGGHIIYTDVPEPLPVIINQPECGVIVAMALPLWCEETPFAPFFVAAVIMQLRLMESGIGGVTRRLRALVAALTSGQPEEEQAAD